MPGEPLETFFIVYIAVWATLTLIAAVLFLRNPREYSITSPGYRQLILVRWKWVTFAIATTGMVVIAPYTGDPTWDYFDAFFMAVFTFISAPWVTGIFFLAVRRKGAQGVPLKHVYVAACMWMVSVSWSYDLYILLRDGYYPLTWAANIPLSSVLYFSAGLLWNLDWRAGRGVTLSFQEADWPHVLPTSDWRKFIWYALPFMILAAVCILVFLIP
jgi:hypothetical protein